MSAVAIANACKSFNGVKAVDDVSFTIEEGEFFSLLGPSGCGKTTLLRMIAGLEFPERGTIAINGQDMSRVPPDRRPVNMVFQSYALFPHLNVFENIAFGLRLARVSDAEIDERVSQALQLVRLPAMAARYPRELSGGQQQRIAFARAVVNRPSVLLLDEPLSALDPKIRVEMQGELARFKRELNITFVMVTHDQSEAFGLSDRIAVMAGGKVEQIGTPQEIYTKPASMFVAGFVGRTNILSAVLLKRTSHSLAAVKVAEAVLQASVDPSEPLQGVQDSATGTDAGSGGLVNLWVRSSAVKIILQPHGQTNALPVEVLHASFQGDWCDYTLKVNDQLQITASISTTGAAPGQALSLAPGQKCHVAIAPEDLHIVRN